MVKKAGCIVGIVLLVFLALLGYWISLDRVPPLRYVPADSPVVVRCTDLEGLWARLEEHPCVQGAPPDVREAVRRKLKLDKIPEPVSPLTQQKISYTVGQELVCAFPGGTGEQPVLATKIHPLLKVAEWAARKAGQVQLDAKDGFPVRNVDVGKGQKLHYVLLSRTFYGSMDREQLLACLNTGSPLETDGDYQTLRAKVSPDEGLEAFIDFQKLSPGLAEAPVAPKKGLLLARLGEEGDLLLEGSIDMGGEKEHQMQKIAPGELEALTAVPQESLLVLATDWSQPLGDTMKLLSKLMNNDNLDPDNLGVWLSLLTVFDLDIQTDLLEAGQEELALVVQDLDVNEVVPVPELTLMLKSSNPDATRDLMYKTLDTVMNNEDCRELLKNYAPQLVVSEEMLPFFEMQEKELDGVKVYAMPNVPLGRMVQPELSAYGDFFYLSTSEQALEAFLAAAKTGKNLAGRPGYGDWRKRRCNASLFVNVGEISKRMEALDEELATLGLLRDMDLEKFEKERRPLYEAIQYMDGLLLCLGIQGGEMTLDGRLHWVGPAGPKTTVE